MTVPKTVPNSWGVAIEPTDKAKPKTTQFVVNSYKGKEQIS